METPSITIRFAETEPELQGILDLQAKNAPANLSAVEMQREGFITARHTLPLLTKMASIAPQIIAISDHKVVAYVLSMDTSLSEELPVLKPMFELFKTIDFKGNKLSSYSLVIGGQACIDKSFRGLGILNKLYAAQQRLHPEHKLCVTEIAVNNVRSMRAHEKVGFQTIHTYTDSNENWNIVVWDWEINEPSKPTVFE
jgi:hypothetical protein